MNPSLDHECGMCGAETRIEVGSMAELELALELVNKAHEHTATERKLFRMEETRRYRGGS